MTARRRSSKAGIGLRKPLRPSAALAKIVGARPLARTEVTKKIWHYIKRHKLQDPRDRRMIRADASLRKVFGGRSWISMFEMSKLLGKQLR